MNNLTMCQQIPFLLNVYTIQYICQNYNIYCDDYCMSMNDADNNCYCHCLNDDIYCYNRNYYLFKFLLAIFTGLVFSGICIMCFLFIGRLYKSYGNLPSYENLPSYDDLHNNNIDNNNNKNKNNNEQDKKN